uniref:Putative secreted protein n=1 Tax=Anopheles darlingi TaxID=43151 RepID=A0A2M4DE93_ANODA
MTRCLASGTRSPASAAAAAAAVALSRTHAGQRVNKHTSYHTPHSPHEHMQDSFTTFQCVQCAPQSRVSRRAPVFFMNGIECAREKENPRGKRWRARRHTR